MIIERGDWQLETGIGTSGVRFGIGFWAWSIKKNYKIWQLTLDIWWSFYISLEWFHYDDR